MFCALMAAVLFVAGLILPSAMKGGIINMLFYGDSDVGYIRYALCTALTTILLIAAVEFLHHFLKRTYPQKRISLRARLPIRGGMVLFGISSSTNMLFNAIIAGWKETGESTEDFAFTGAGISKLLMWIGAAEALVGAYQALRELYGPDALKKTAALCKTQMQTFMGRPQASGASWKCPGCGAELDASDAFCPACGTARPAVRHCPQCGSIVPGESNFCRKCGAPLNAKAPAKPADSGNAQP